MDVLGWHVSRPDLQLMFHGLDNPSGDPWCTHTIIKTYTYTVKHRIEPTVIVFSIASVCSLRLNGNPLFTFKMKQRLKLETADLFVQQS